MVKPAIAILISILVGYAAGRFTAPHKVVTETKEVIVTKEVEVIAKNDHKKTKVTETDKPDGTKTIVTTIVDDSNESDSKQTDTKDSKESKVTVYSNDRHNLSLAVGSTLKLPGLFSPRFGAIYTIDVLGPISVGAFGFTDRSFGVTLGLSF